MRLDLPTYPKIWRHIWILEIWVSSTSFEKNKIGWPPQFWQKGYQMSVNHLIFDDLFIKKELVILVVGIIQPSGWVNVLMKWSCRRHWGPWGCWSCWGHWGCRCSKDLKITTSGLQSDSALIWCFEKNMFCRIMKNVMLNFSTFSVEANWCFIFFPSKFFINYYFCHFFWYRQW